MPVRIKDRLPLFIILLVFVALKIPHLHYAYFWDESWPYAPALRAMYLHGPGLMPNAIDPELSRGHPLLFHALAATWMKIFGTSHVSLHSFALLISILFLIFIYARWVPHRSRHRCPYRLLRCWRVGKTRIWQILKPGISIVLQLGAKCNPQSVFY